MKAAVARHIRQDADIDALIDNRINDRGPVAHFDGDLDVRVKPMERRDQRHAGHGIAEPDAQFAALECVVLPKNRERLSLDPMQLRCDGDELAAQRSRQEFAAAPFKQRDAEMIFQASNLLGDRRLRQAEPPGGA